MGPRLSPKTGGRLAPSGGGCASWQKALHAFEAQDVEAGALCLVASAKVGANDCSALLVVGGSSGIAVADALRDRGRNCAFSAVLQIARGTALARWTSRDCPLDLTFVATSGHEYENLGGHQFL